MTTALDQSAQHTDEPEMLEQVARAIFGSLHGDTHTGGWDAMTGDVNVSKGQKDRFRRMARAAITAYRRASGAQVTPDGQLREALQAADDWLGKWADHASFCRGVPDACACGLNAVRARLSQALPNPPQQAEEKA